MTEKQNILAILRGEKTNSVPAGFWLHFPESQFYGDAAVKAHLRFFEKTKTGIQKIMNENLVPWDVPIKKASDWRNLKPFTKDAPFIKNQVEMIKKILEHLDGSGLVLATIHGIVASAWHARGGSAGYETGSQLLADHLREDPEAVSYGWNILSDALAILTEECLRAGVDGIYYAALGGESYLFTDEEFQTYITPHDRKILQAAQGKDFVNVLHLCKDRLNLKRYRDYPCAVVNWAVHEQNPSLLEGAEIFPDKVILGGLDDRAGVLVDGTEQQITAEVRRTLKTMEGKRFILGADCTLPTEIDYDRIKIAVNAAK